MPDLIQSLLDKDLGHLQIVAEFWGVDLHAPDARSALPELALAILDPQVVEETIDILPAIAREALDALVANQGRITWAAFSRQFGEIRVMGPGRRDREQAHRNPISAAETLWYRALVARAFFDTPRGPEEFAYIPENLLPFLRDEGLTPSEVHHSQVPLGRPATAAEKAHRIAANDRVLDDACTLLAARRMAQSVEQLDLAWSVPVPALRAILAAAGVLDVQGDVVLDKAKTFLEMARGQALAQLVSQWRSSELFNELVLIPHLLFEGKWANQPRETREKVLSILESLPPDGWWSLPAFVQSIRDTMPDFQRKAGDYDSWYIRDRRTGQYLRGFESWDSVDGELIRYLIYGPLHWLGIFDLAAPEPDGPITAFRRSSLGPALLAGKIPGGLPRETKPAHVRSDGRYALPYLAPRVARYQLARFGEWEGERGGAYRYRLTPDSLAQARESGLRVSHLLALLEKYADSTPPNVVKALDRWDRQGAEARLEQVTVLRLNSPDLLQALRRSRAARFLGTPLGPTAIVVKDGAGDRVLAILAEMGYLGKVQFDHNQEKK